MPDPDIADEIVVTAVGLDTQPMPLVFDEEGLGDPWSLAGADADPPEELA